MIESFVNFLGKIMFFSSFVSSATGFPKPLKPEEEKELVIKFRAGDMEARKKLIEHNLRLVSHIVKKYSTAGDADDLISSGTIGLIKAVDSFSVEKNTQLSTYASRCIENEILMLLRLTKKHNVLIGLEESMGKDKEGNEITLQDVLADEESDLSLEIEKIVLSEKILKIMKESLPEREYQIICLRYGLGGCASYPQRIVAKKLGISRSYISRLESKALNTLKTKIKDKNLL